MSSQRPRKAKPAPVLPPPEGEVAQPAAARVEKTRYRDPRQRKSYPLARFNSWCARPLSAGLAAARLTPNGVSGLSALASGAGVAVLVTGDGLAYVAAAALLHLGLLLDHADGQVARRRALGSTWGMYLDMVLDRLVEIAVIGAVTWAALKQPHAASGLPDAWQPMGAAGVALSAVLATGLMQAWRYFTSYNDVLYLREHLREQRRLPRLESAGLPLRRPLVPWAFNRDVVLLIATLGIAFAQFQALLVVFVVLHALALAEKIVVFRLVHPFPEGHAAQVLRDDFH